VDVCKVVGFGIELAELGKAGRRKPALLVGDAGGERRGHAGAIDDPPNVGREIGAVIDPDTDVWIGNGSDIGGAALRANDVGNAILEAWTRLKLRWASARQVFSNWKAPVNELVLKVVAPTEITLGETLG
jgi:hypothetical protein